MERKKILKKDNCKIKSIAIYKKVKYPYKDTTINCPLTATLKNIKKKTENKNKTFSQKIHLNIFLPLKMKQPTIQTHEILI